MKMDTAVKSLKNGLLALTVLLMGVGCAHYPANPPLKQFNPEAGYRFDNLSAPAKADALFIVLTFSGGGTRAAALSYGVLEALRGTRFTWQGTERSLLDEVDVISSVSGGSFTAAYYGLFGNGIFTDKRFFEKFLYHDVQGDLIRQMFMPTNWFKLAGPDFSRTDLAVEYYSRNIFIDRRFSDLVQSARRPMVMINATDMTTGAPFTFIQDQFDPICSDLSGVAVARAVAASSCFPVAFPALTFNNYGGSCNYRTPEWVENAAFDLQTNPPRYARAQTLRAYENAKERPYLHLLDGGVSDNIGLRGPLTRIRSTDPPFSILRLLNTGRISHLVVIIVDAKSKKDDAIDETSSPPGLKTVLTKISTVPLDNYSFDTVQSLRDAFEKWRKDDAIYTACDSILKSQCPGKHMPYPPAKRVELYPIYIGFDQIENATERREFQTMDTSFYLNAAQVDALRDIGGKLMTASGEYQRLVETLGITAGQ